MKKALSDSMVERVVDRFRALGDPTRVRILMALQDGETKVGDLAERLGVGQASMSKHLDRLRQVGIVDCRRDGNQAFYGVRDREIYKLCDLVCGAVSRHLAAEQAALEA